MTERGYSRMASVQHSLITEIETLSFKALPALESRYYDGWLLRYADGYTRRANSVNPIYESHEDIDLKISHCETIYTRKNRPTIFKMTDAVYPDSLDDVLTMKGYTKEAETGVYTLSFTEEYQLRDNIRIDTKLTTTWLNNFVRLNNITASNAKTLEQMLGLIPTQCGYLSLIEGEQVIGVALGVVDEAWMGIFDVVVDANRRGKGHGRVIMQSLLSWGMVQGAEQAYLQVQADNIVATQLYQSLGFTHQYNYWYRVK